MRTSARRPKTLSCVTGRRDGSNMAHTALDGGYRIPVRIVSLPARGSSICGPGSFLGALVHCHAGNPLARREICSQFVALFRSIWEGRLCAKKVHRGRADPNRAVPVDIVSQSHDTSFSFCLLPRPTDRGIRTKYRAARRSPRRIEGGETSTRPLRRDSSSANPRQHST